MEVSEEVLEGLDAVRESGQTNMFDRPVVIKLAEQMGFRATANWIRDHHKEYTEGIFQGFAKIE